MRKCGESSGERVTYGPLTSAGITTVAEALAFYGRYLAGDHELFIGRERKRFIASFDPYEIHLFTESLKPGEQCPANLLVRRQDRGRREVRRLDVRRARLFERILPSLEQFVFCIPAKTGGGMLVYGPEVSKSEHLCVVLEPAGRKVDLLDVYFVRSAWPASKAKFREDGDARRSRRILFPP
jgi:hypothetical protein